MLIEVNIPKFQPLSPRMQSQLLKEELKKERIKAKF